MSVKIITYDLNKEKNGDDRKKLLEKIKSFEWAMLSESSYAVDTHHTTKQLFDLLKPFLDNNDRVFIGILEREANWIQGKDITSWLQKRL
ncbi:MAG: hypothetical protein QNL04_12525 [SAR324 cluster bacterium]|nr:hypothetical protein [SAR324 cluster bacterium]